VLARGLLGLALVKADRWPVDSAPVIHKPGSHRYRLRVVAAHDGPMTRTTTAARKRPHKRQPSKPHPLADTSPGAETSCLLRVGAPAGILAIIPHLLGFTPRDSLVVIGIREPKGEVKISMRYDLPPAGSCGLEDDIADHALAVLRSQRLYTAIAVGYGPRDRVDLLVETLQRTADGYGVELKECLRQDNGRYWSYCCDDEACCPLDGVPFDPAGDPAALALAAAKLGGLPNREALAASIAPIGGIAAEAMREATRRAERHVTQTLAKVRRSHKIGAARHMIANEGLAAVSRLISAYRSGEKYKTEYELAWLMVALKDMRIRDDAWARMDPQFSESHRRLWTDAVRRAQPGYAAAPAALLAFVAWQSGNGALANVALDRALADNPDYSMAHLLRDVITAGAPPSLARPPMTPEEVAASYAEGDTYHGACEAGNTVAGGSENEREVELAAGEVPVPAMTGQITVR
jgi:hypothetical protein